MNPMLQKLIDQGFMTEEQAAYLADAIGKKHNIIISGHRGHGTLPLMATLGSVAQGAGKLKPVRNIANDLKDDSVTYYLIGDLKDVDFPSLLTDVLSTEQASIITIKEESDIDSLFSSGVTTALQGDIRGLDDFELITFLVIKQLMSHINRY